MTPALMTTIQFIAEQAEEGLYRHGMIATHSPTEFSSELMVMAEPGDLLLRSRS